MRVVQGGTRDSCGLQYQQLKLLQLLYYLALHLPFRRMTSVAQIKITDNLVSN